MPRARCTQSRTPDDPSRHPDAMSRSRSRSSPVSSRASLPAEYTGGKTSAVTATPIAAPIAVSASRSPSRIGLSEAPVAITSSAVIATQMPLAPNRRQRPAK